MLATLTASSVVSSLPGAGTLSGANLSAAFSAGAAHAADFLAEETKGREFGKASPIGMVVVLLLLVATVLLIRSMNGRIKSLPESFDPAHPEPDQAVDEGTDNWGTGDPYAPRPSDIGPDDVGPGDPLRDGTTRGAGS